MSAPARVAVTLRRCDFVREGIALICARRSDKTASRPHGLTFAAYYLKRHLSAGVLYMSLVVDLDHYKDQHKQCWAEQEVP